ncbi:MAG: hypothetical protein JSV31_26560 [Desulfobacterales bacterium]|nr:MAG: hypothetical protein JSV31_26560 [Desulfobacterales bacterium]
MKLFRITWGILIIGILLMSSSALAYAEILWRQKLENVNAMEAIAIANEWKWSRKDVKTSITAREVVFEFSDKTVKRIPLPQEKMLVAVAPYIRRTHK